MKFLIIASIIFAATIGNTYASCDGAYLNYLKSAQQREAERQKYNNKMMLLQMTGSGIGAFVATDLGAKAAIASTAGADSTIISTAVVPFFLAGIFLGGVTSIKIADHYIEGDKSASELENIKELTSSLRLLKEAAAGEGTILESFMPIVWREVSPTVALQDLSGVINKLNDENSFCQNSDELETRNGILTKAISELKENK